MSILTDPGCQNNVAAEPAELPEAADIQSIVQALRQTPLHENHLADLRASGLDDDTIRTAGLCSAPAAATGLLGFHDTPALVIPYVGHPGYVRIKPDVPRVDAHGRAIKYETPRGGRNHLYIPSRTRQRLIGIGPRAATIIITEGEKKALKADQEGFAVISVPGVWGWRSVDALRELAEIDWEGRRAVIAFDSDVTRKPDVKAAIAALVEHLKKLKAEVRVVVLPDIDGHEKTGLDDYLVASGCEGLRALLDNAGDWFATLLAMLECGLEPEPLEAAVRPLNELIGEAGAVSQEELVRRLRNRLKELGYTPPPVAELKRHCRDAQRQRRNQPAAGQRAANEPEIRFMAEGPDGAYRDHPEKQGLYDYSREQPVQLTNFSMFIDHEVQVHDDLQPHKRFSGRIELQGRPHPFAIDAADYANNGKLTAAIYEAAGSKIEIHCKPEVLRTAISAVSVPDIRRIGTNFGWNAEKTAYLVPGGQITATGFHDAEDNDMQVDLSDQEFAKRLKMKPLTTEQLVAVKRHVVDDLLQLCPDRKVGYSLIAAVALSVLYRFTSGMNKPLIWVSGLSGSGKSHSAKLVQNFFGEFPIAGEKGVMSWGSTPKRIQHEGYYFRDAMYVVDDYKPEHCKPGEATWVLQGYADAAARSRLRRDATAAESREIRGLLLCTGEDVPDHSASATARIIKIPYPKAEIDLVRGRRCQQQCQHYSGLMADFIRHLLANDRPAAFVARVAALQDQFCQAAKGHENIVRVAGNFALLAAAFEEMAEYLKDVWPGADDAKRAFIEQHIPALRGATLNDVHEQKASCVFLSTLGMLVKQGSVLIRGLQVEGATPTTAKPIGKRVLQARACPAATAPASGGRVGAPREPQQEPVLEIWTTAAFAEVQQSLRQQARPPIAVTLPALLQQLREDGVLLDAEGNVIPPESDDDATKQVKIGKLNRNGFRIKEAELMRGWD